MTDNIYRIDDTLIRSGFILGVVVLFVTLTGKVKSLLYTLPLWSFPLLALLIIAPVAMLATGYGLRHRERRLADIWRMVKKHGEVSTRELCQLSGLRRDDLRAAITLLNRKTTAGLIWDTTRGTVRQIQSDSGHRLTHSERCHSCGASVSIEVASSSRARDLACRYCGGALDAQSISELQSKLMARPDLVHRQTDTASAVAPPRQEPDFLQAPPPQKPAKRFSLLIFVLLMMFFWPAALWYAIARAQSGQLSL